MSSALDPFEVAVQGVGYGPESMFVQGFVSYDFAPPDDPMRIGFLRASVAKRNRIRRDDELLLLFL